MAKSKYDKNTFPILAEGWAREGLIDKQIAKNLGVSVSTFNTYKIKHPEFMDSLKKGKGPVDFEVENALLKRALGYEYDETHSEIKTEAYEAGKPGADKSATDNKRVITKTFTTTKVITKHIVPDIAAIIFWLKNRKSGKWRDKVDDTGPGTENMTDLLKEFSAEIRKGDTNG